MIMNITPFTTKKSLTYNVRGLIARGGGYDESVTLVLEWIEGCRWPKSGKKTQTIPKKNPSDFDLKKNVHLHALGAFCTRNTGYLHFVAYLCRRRATIQCKSQNCPSYNPDSSLVNLTFFTKKWVFFMYNNMLKFTITTTENIFF